MRSPAQVAAAPGLIPPSDHDTTVARQLARFVTDATFKDLSEQARTAIKLRLLDSIGCALGALDGEPVRKVRALVDELGGTPTCTLIGSGKTSPDRAALYNGALIRYLDFNDSYLATGETCHPSDNIGACIAAAEYADRSGADLLLAIAVAYQVQCRLSDVAPVRHRGFDHTTQGAYAAACGVAKALDLDAEQTADAIAISGTALNALRVTRTGALSHWKGLAYPFTGFGATNAAFLARAGITGPAEVFEGNKGFIDAIAGDFTIDWADEDLERVCATATKKYNAEIHSQSAIEGALELRAEHDIDPATIERIDLEVFDVAYDIIGGGAEGDKTVVKTKEEADHSLPYIVAVALLDGDVGPEQYQPERIAADDVQALLRKIRIRPCDDLSDRFPSELPCRIEIRLSDRRVVARDKPDYEGYRTRPAAPDTIARKFERLGRRFADAALREEIIAAVNDLEHAPVSRLTELLSRANPAGEGDR